VQAIESAQQTSTGPRHRPIHSEITLTVPPFDSGGSRTTGLRARRRSQQSGGLETAACGRKQQDSTARRLPGPAGCRLSDGAKLPRLLRIVSGLAENTNSIFCDGPQGPETANGCLVQRSQEPTAERSTCELRILWQVRCARSHERASGELCFPLDKDLHGCRLLLP
jgi:hypothetical protein